MFNFVFSLPTTVFFGKGEIKQLSTVVQPSQKILLTYGGGSIKKNGVYDQVKEALKGYSLVEFGGIEPNPQFSTLMQAVELARKEKVDFILAVGGGSVLDGSKFIAAAFDYQGDVWNLLLDRGASIRNPLPLGSVLTLPATGSEMNGNGVISRKETGDKLVISSPLLRPQFAILDPVTTYSLPNNQTANGIIDAFVHVLEQYLTYPVDAKIPDRFAEGVLCTLIEDGEKVLKEPENYAARANIMWAATMALNGILSTGVPQDWASHMIGHELTAVYGLDHAQTLAIVAPVIMEYKKAGKKEKLVQYAKRVWNYQGDNADDAVTFAIQQTRVFFEKLGVATKLTAYNVDTALLSKVMQKLEEHFGKDMKLGEKQDITLHDAEKILQQAR